MRIALNDGTWMRFEKSPAQRIREACEGFLDQGRGTVTWLELADRSGVDPDEVLRLLAEMADDPSTGVKRKSD